MEEEREKVERDREAALYEINIQAMQKRFELTMSHDRDLLAQIARQSEHFEFARSNEMVEAIRQLEQVQAAKSHQVSTLESELSARMLYVQQMGGIRASVYGRTCLPSSSRFMSRAPRA